jgi:hypothetical protein
MNQWMIKEKLMKEMYPMRCNSPNAVADQTEVGHEAEGYLKPSAG